MSPGVILSVGGWLGGQAKDLLAMLNGPKEILRLPTRPPPTLRMTPGFIRSEGSSWDHRSIQADPSLAQDDTDHRPMTTTPNAPPINRRAGHRPEWLKIR